jgi:hypothetical protein
MGGFEISRGERGAGSRRNQNKMDPLTLSLFAIGGLWVLSSKKSKSKSNGTLKYIPTIPFSSRGLELTCSSIEVTDKEYFEDYINAILEDFHNKNPSFIVTISNDYLNLLDNCYLQILKDYSLKCVPKYETEKSIVYLIKQRISGEFNQSISHQDAKSLQKYMDLIVNPAMKKLISNLGLTGKTDLIWANFLYTGKYPNTNYKIPEDIGFQIGCSQESFIQITDLEKFDQYLKDIVKELSYRPEFKDPYLIDFEKFIDEYLKIINNYCYRIFKSQIISDAGIKILFILIQYGLQNYIEEKFSTEELREKYRKEFFNADLKELLKLKNTRK